MKIVIAMIAFVVAILSLSLAVRNYESAKTEQARIEQSVPVSFGPDLELADQITTKRWARRITLDATQPGVTREAVLQKAYRIHEKTGRMVEVILSRQPEEVVMKDTTTGSGWHQGGWEKIIQ